MRTKMGKIATELEKSRTIIGAWSMVSPVQIFLAETLVILAWTGADSYSLTGNVISDLGAAQCGLYNGRDVCSPLNWLMNVSFVLQGVALILGATLLNTTLLGVAAKLENANDVRIVAARWARALLICAGVGVALVGLFPEDTLSWLHFSGAALFFFAGAAALAVFWWLWHSQSWINGVLLLAASTAILATVAFMVLVIWWDVPGVPGGLLERLIVYPIVLGVAAVGANVARGSRTIRHERHTLS